MALKQGHGPRKLRTIEKEELNFEAENKSAVIKAWSDFDIDPVKQEFIKKNKDKLPDILQLMRAAFNDNSLTQYSPEFKNVKNFYASLGRTEKKGGTRIVPLSDSQLEYVYNNAFNTKPQEMAYQLFESRVGDENFMRAAAQTIGWLRNAFDLQYLGPDADVLEDIDIYVPPSNPSEIVAKINKFASPPWELNKTLSIEQKEAVKLLKMWMGLPRFSLTANFHKKQELRNLFELEFIQAVYDKAESLTPEDVNNYISLSNEYVREIVITSQVSTFENLAEEAAKGKDIDSKFNKNISDSLKSVQTQLQACKSNIARLSKTLNGELSKRKDFEIQSGSSFAKMVNEFRNENIRKKLERARDKYNENVLKPELQKIVDHKPEVAEFYGVNINEILGFSQDII